MVDFLAALSHSTTFTSIQDILLSTQPTTITTFRQQNNHNNNNHHNIINQINNRNLATSEY